MNILFDEILKKLDQLEDTYKKFNILERKKERMGLTTEESVKLKEIKSLYYDDFNVFLNTLMEQLINSLLSTDGKKCLLKIKEMVPWSGKNILTVDDFEEILDAGEKLTTSDIIVIEESLISLHLDVFKGLEQICKNKSVYDALDEIGKSISLSSDGGISDVVTYIDDMYRDFGEIFGIELPEVKLYYY